MQRSPLLHGGDKSMNSNKDSTGGQGAGAAKLIVLSVIALAMMMTGCGDRKSGSSGNVVIETDLGTIKFELLDNEAPKTAENFRLLAERGYYNGTIFHRVIAGFMIQGGDPNGDGSGGESATGAPLPNEIDRNLPLYQGGYQRGLVAMANKGRPETGGSQFFIMHQRYPLPANYTIFGRVTEGMDVVDKIATAPNTGTSTMNRPVTPVKVNKLFIE
jgi:cyclophilin family peptidyl-prolyl cis-trans isomerase